LIESFLETRQHLPEKVPQPDPYLQKVHFPGPGEIIPEIPLFRRP
jgi:hypothetical protein